MVIYKVTTELRTPWWLKILRFFRLKNKREEFEVQFEKDWWQKGDIIRTNNCNALVLDNGNVDID